jgi:hypothetical protein
MKDDHLLITRIARARPSGGPNGKANPTQKASSIGRRATVSTAPARRPRHRSHPATTSSPQTPKNAMSSGTVVRMPIRPNGIHRTPETRGTSRPHRFSRGTGSSRRTANRNRVQAYGEDRSDPHHRLGGGVRSTRSDGSYSFRRVGCLLSIRTPRARSGSTLRMRAIPLPPLSHSAQWFIFS